MSTWLIIADETTDKESLLRQTKVIKRLPGNKSREEALAELYKVAKGYVPDSLKGAQRLVARDVDGSFWILPKNGAGHASCNIRLIEQIHP
ncbi:hypothetical protein ABZZ20_30660 [Streptomyces sp. NPDC006430]|uniref:hypothetical protein n=1 Tax=Streptomyces sp. NPDC006430 TaxID=3154299 RepID=UPI0033B24A9E